MGYTKYLLLGGTLGAHLTTSLCVHLDIKGLQLVVFKPQLGLGWFGLVFGLGTKGLQIARSKFIPRKNQTPQPQFGFGLVRVPNPKPEPGEIRVPSHYRFLELRLRSSVFWGISVIPRKNQTPRPWFCFDSVRDSSPKPEPEETEFRVATDSSNRGQAKS